MMYRVETGYDRVGWVRDTLAQDVWVILMYPLALSARSEGCAVSVGVRHVGWYRLPVHTVVKYI